MADLSEVVRNRRMSRSFTTEEVDPAAIERIISLASRAPSAGKAQGWHVVSLVGDETASYWDATLPEQRRDDFTWPGLLRAPVILVLVADPDAYDRTIEPHWLDRKPFTDADMAAIRDLHRVANRANWTDIAAIVGKVHLYHDVSVIHCYDWLLEIAELTGDQQLIDETLDMRMFFIGR